jgi:ribose transport system substrate-binding protein
MAAIVFCFICTIASSEVTPIKMPDITGMKVGKVGFIPFQFNNNFWSNVSIGFHKIVKDQGGTVLDVDPMGDPIKEAEGIDRLIASGVQGICMSVVDAKAIVPSVEAANKANIPIVVMMDAPAGGEVICVIQPDFILQGYMAGTQLVKDLNKKGNVILIEFPVDKTCFGRVEGFLKALEPYPKIKIVATDIATGNPEGNSAKTAAMISAHPDINAALVAWDDVGLAMIPALKDAGLDQGQVKIYSVDGTEPAIKAMKEGKAFRASATLYPAQMAEMAAKVLISYINGKKPPAKYIGMGTGCYTSDDAKAGKGILDVLPKNKPMFWEMSGEIIPTGKYEWVKSRK